MAIEVLGDNLLLSSAVLGLLVLTLIVKIFQSSGSGKSPPLPPQALKWYEDDLPSMIMGTLPGKIEQRFQKYNDKPFRGRQLGSTTVNIHTTAMLRKVLAAENELVVSDWPPSTKYLLGNSAVSSVTKAAHSRLRKVLSPAFAATAVERYMPGTQAINVLNRLYSSVPTHMQAIITEYVNKWAKDGSFNVVEGARSMTFAIMCKIMLGFDEWFQDGTLQKAAHDFDIWLAGLFMPGIYIPGTLYYNSCQARTRLLKMIENVLEPRVKARDANPENVKPQNLLDSILAGRDEGKPLCRAMLLDNIITLLFAGHDTSASTLMYGLWLLSTQHQDVWQKLYEEQQAIVKKHGEAITPEVLKEMKYTNAVVQELLRIRPIIPFVPRKAIADFEVGGYRVEKGNTLWLWIGRSTHEASCKDSTGPMDPAAFNPDRWLAEGAVNSAAFMPFGGGARTCLGFPLATMELKVTLAVLARGYTLDAPAQVEWTPFPILRPKDGKLQISVVPRL